MSIAASDGELADTTTVTIRVTNADDPGTVALSAEVARVGELLTATLMDEDISRNQGKRRWWQRSGDGASWTNIPGAASRSYTPVAADAGKWLRAVFTYADGHGPGKRAESAAVLVRTVNAAPVFDADSYEREVAENSAAGTKVGAPVTAADPDSTSLTYSFVGDGTPFEIDAATGQLTVAEDAALDNESGDTLHAVSVEASDGELADTATVTIRVTNVPAPGKPEAPVVTGGTGEVTPSWLAPANEGPEITSYDLRYRAQGDSAWTDVPSVGAVLSHTIGELDAGTTYLGQARAEGAGEWSEPGEGATAAPVNRAPAFAAAAVEREVAEKLGGRHGGGRASDGGRSGQHVVDVQLRR